VALAEGERGHQRRAVLQREAHESQPLAQVQHLSIMAHVQHLLHATRHQDARAPRCQSCPAASLHSVCDDAASSEGDDEKRRERERERERKESDSRKGYRSHQTNSGWAGHGITVLSRL